MQFSPEGHFLNEEDIQHFSNYSYLVKEPALPDRWCNEALAFAQKKYSCGNFKKAKLTQNLNIPEIRGDFTYWLEDSEIENLSFMSFFINLKDELSQVFFLNLKKIETHFAVYPPNNGYDKHVDQPRNQNNVDQRLITFVLYLNQNWSNTDGGELKIELQNESQKVEPTWNKLVLFRSDEIYHQVLRSNFFRWSLTGWFRA